MKTPNIIWLAGVALAGLAASGLSGGCSRSLPAGPDLFECNGYVVRCIQTDLWDGSCLSYGDVPCHGTVCADNEYEAADLSVCEAATCSLRTSNACPGPYGATSDGLVGTTPDYTIHGTLVPSLSGMNFTIGGTTWSTSLDSSSNIDFMDGGGDGSPGLLAITSLELYGTTVLFSDASGYHTISSPTVIAADPMGGRKQSNGTFNIVSSTIQALNFATIDGYFETLGTGPDTGSYVVGSIDYSASQITLAGEINGSDPTSGTSISVEFQAVFSFPPAPRPEPAITRVVLAQNLIEFDVNGSIMPPGEYLDGVTWFRGNQPLDTGYLNPNDIIGYGPKIQISSQAIGNDSVVTAYIITDAGQSAVSTACYWTGDPTACYPQ